MSWPLFFILFSHYILCDNIAFTHNFYYNRIKKVFLMSKRWIWKYVGVFGIFSNIAIASYYCYIESWTISYIFHSLFGTFDGMSQFEVAAFFTNYLDVTTSTTGIPFEALVFFVLCLALNIWILSKGLSGGIEKVAKIGVPMLIVFGIFLA